MAFTGPQTYTWRDAKGATAKTSFYVNDTASSFTDAESAAGAVRAATAALTNAALAGAHGFDSELSTGAYGTAAVYENVEDKALLTMLAADGTLHRFAIPAPKSSIFTADGQTVDKGNTAVVSWVTAMTGATATAQPSTRGGVFYVSLIGGIRQRRRMQRRMSIYTLSAKLDEQAE